MTTSEPCLRIGGLVERAVALSFEDLARIDAAYQIADVATLDPKRSGGAIQLSGLLALARPDSRVRYLTLHSSADDFHASIPLDAVRDRAILIYRLADGPLPVKAGGPIRFFIPNFAACQTHEVDECANVKFVDQLEFSIDPGQDNRPTEEEEHAELHRRQGS